MNLHGIFYGFFDFTRFFFFCSINALFYFVDTITWPEALRQYLRSDNGYYAEPLSIFEKFPEYPVCPKIKQEAEEEETGAKRSFIEARIQMLGFLADQFLTTSGVREDITNEGALAGEDHCRVCFRVVSTKIKFLVSGHHSAL